MYWRKERGHWWQGDSQVHVGHHGAWLMLQPTISIGCLRNRRDYVRLLVHNCLEGLKFVQVVAELKVIFTYCDGESSNRKFFIMHDNDCDKETYKTCNPVNKDHHIYFISDPPHLLKTIWNCFSNWYAHKQSQHAPTAWRPVLSYTSGTWPSWPLLLTLYVLNFAERT